MKQLFAITLLAALGCGAYDPIENATDGEAAEYGQVSEALTRQAPYGSLRPNVPGQDVYFGGECKASWSNAYRCTIPADRTFRMRNDLPTTGPFNAPNLVKATLDALMSEYQDFGWTITTNGTDSTEKVYLVGTTTECPSPTALACAITDHASGTLVTIGGLQYRKASRCKIAIQYSNWNLSGLTPAENLNRTQNVLRHEIGHCLGLAHMDFQGGPNAALGVMYGSNGSINTDLYYTAAQNASILNYVP